MRRSRRLVGLLWRWHRRLGVVAAVFVLMLAVTGIALNHTSELGLDRHFVDWPWLARVYGDDSAELPAFRPRQQWIFRAANGRVYLDSAEVAPCSGELVGAVQLPEMVVAACAQELLLITRAGELLELVNPSAGLSLPLQGIGMIGPDVALQSRDGWRLADLDALDFSRPVPSGALIQQFAPGKLPAAIARDIPAQEAWLSWERVVLDVHSGRVLGRPGVLLVDGIGVFLALLATSGLAMWWLHRRR